MRKRLTYIIMVLFIVQVFASNIKIDAKAAVDTSLTISGYTVSSTTINKGDTFTAKLNITNNSSASMKYIYLNISTANSSYYPTNGESTIKVYDNAVGLGAGQTVPVTISLTYGGGTDKKLYLDLIYNTVAGLPEDGIVSKTISFNAKDPSEIPAPVPVDTKKYMPKLGIAAASAPIVNAGNVVNVVLPVKNTSNQTATDITITPVIEKDDNFIFVEDFNATKNISQLNANATENVSFQFRVAANAIEKNYAIKVNMEYSNVFGDSFTTQSIVYLKVAAAPSTVSTLEIANVTNLPETIEAGEKTNITINVKNTGTSTLKGIKVSLSGIKEDALAISSGAARKTITELLPGQATNVAFSLNALKKATEGNYAVNIRAEAKDSSDKVVTDEQSFFIGIKNSASSGLDITTVLLTPQSLEAGGKTTVEIIAKNNGNYKLDSLKFTLGGFKEEAISIVDGSNKKVVKTLAPDEECKVIFALVTSKKAVDGNYTINAKVECKDKSEKLIGDEQSVYLGITKKEVDESNIEIRDLSVPNTALVSNKEFSLGFALLNSGTESIKNIKVTLTPDPLLIAKTPTAKAVSKLAANKKLPLKFLFMIPRDAADKNYPIQINVEYEITSNGQKVKQTVNQYTNVYVDNFGVSGNKKSVPKIIISNYSIDPTIPKAGSNIKLNVSFLNTNLYKSVKNIKISLAADGSQTELGNVFVPVNSSNTFYLDSINPKQTIKKELELYIVNDAKPKTYNLTANFEYEDEAGTEYKATEAIGIPVRPQTKLETSTILLPTEVSIIDPLSVSFDLYNTGKSMLRNLMIKSVGNFDVQNQNSFIGNLDVGSQEHYEASIVPKAPGKLKGYVLITFEDAAGQIQQIKQEISTTVINPPPVTNPDQGIPGEMDPGKSAGFDKKLIFIPVAIVVVLASAIIIIKKRKRKKLEELMLSE